MNEIEKIKSSAKRFCRLGDDWVEITLGEFDTLLSHIKELEAEKAELYAIQHDYARQYAEAKQQTAKRCAEICNEQWDKQHTSLRSGYSDGHQDGCERCSNAILSEFKEAKE